MQQEPIHVGCATDQQFVLYTSVMLFSLFENNRNASFHIHLLFKPSPTDYLIRLRSLVTKYGHTLNVYEIDDKIAKDYIVSGHVSFATYYRLFFAELLGNEIKKLIYIDSDMLLLSDVKPLYNLVLDDHIVAAVETSSSNDAKRLGLDPSHGYFNAGLLIIDLEKWRSQQITQKATDFISKNPDKINFWDQDALNAVLVGSWKKLPAVWNTQVSNFKDADLKLPAAIKILHFTGEHKPWSIHYTGPFKSIYIKYQSCYFFKNDILKFFTESRVGRLKRYLKSIIE